MAGAAATLGGFALTIVGNVPLNRSLAASGDIAWHDYRGRWGRANTVRGVLSVGGAVLLALGSR